VGHPEQQPSYPGARTTPTVDGKFLFALGSDGDLACLEIATGKEVWRKHLRTDFGGKYGEWAYSESPLVDGDKLIVTPGSTNATVVALNKKTGATMCRAGRKCGGLFVGGQRGAFRREAVRPVSHKRIDGH
jgi:outer membrane protein assembly factor BamB